MFHTFCVYVMLCLCFCLELRLKRYWRGDIEAWHGMHVIGSDKYHSWPLDTPQTTIEEFQQKYLENRGILMDAKIEKGKWTLNIRFDGVFQGLVWVPASYILYLDEHACNAFGLPMPSTDNLQQQASAIICAYDGDDCDTDGENNSDSQSLDSNETPPPDCQVARSFGMLRPYMFCYPCFVLCTTYALHGSPIHKSQFTIYWFILTLNRKLWRGWGWLSRCIWRVIPGQPRKRI